MNNILNESATAIGLEPFPLSPPLNVDNIRHRTKKNPISMITILHIYPSGYNLAKI